LLNAPREGYTQVLELRGEVRLMAEEVVVTKSNFNAEVISSPVPVVADFWAEWCGPCKMIAPVLKDLAAQYKDKLKVAKIDVDQEPELATQFNIVSIPTLLFFNKGQVVKQQIGALPRPALEKIIKEMI
jgi:thioredoxin 1